MTQSVEGVGGGGAWGRNTSDKSLQENHMSALFVELDIKNYKTGHIWSSGHPQGKFVLFWFFLKQVTASPLLRSY